MQKVSEYCRYCPDQPQVRISDAICLGRRRSRFPQCPGCQFNDEPGRGVGGGSSKVSADRNRTDVIERIFVGYNVQAKYPEVLTDEIAWRIGHATASYLRGALHGLDRSDPVATTVIVGRDARPSSRSLADTFVEGARSTGANVVDIGLIDTPQLYFAVNHLRACGGVQTTGSEAPADYSGFRFSGQAAKSVGPDTGLLDISRIAQNMARHDTGQEGALRTLDLTDEYRAFVRGHLQQARPTKIAVDASNGVAAHWLPVLFDDATALEFTYINTELNGRFAHDPDPLTDDNLCQLQDHVKSTKADLGVCFDGDAGRLVVLDEHADVVRGDILTALLARQFLERHPGATVVYDLRSSRVLAEEVKAAGGVPRRERVGQPFIKKALAESKAVFGGGLGGRFYFRDNFHCDSAVLALVHLINGLSRRGASLAELVRPLLRYANSGQHIISHAAPDAAIRQLAGIYGDARVDFLDGITVQYKNWWFNARKSMTSAEPGLGLIVEANDKKLLRQKVQEVMTHLGSDPSP